MPTENRSSNTEMVSFPRELSDDLAELIAHRARVCGGGAFEIWEAICEGFGQAVTQPHPEPIAWMVGTAFWWTKEEAERDAAATGLLVVPVGPLTDSAEAEQHQGDPVVLPARLPQRMPQGRNLPRNYAEAWNACLTEVEKLGPLYPRADLGEGDRLSKATAFVQRLVDCAGTQPSVATGYLRDILDELKGNTTPTAPVERDERAAFEHHHRICDLERDEDCPDYYRNQSVQDSWEGWQARAEQETRP